HRRSEWDGGDPALRARALPPGARLRHHQRQLQAGRVPGPRKGTPVIVCENTTEATPEAVRTRVDRVGRDLSAAISRSPSAWLQAQWVDWRAQLVRIREESMQRPEVSIALVGGTGAGKSTLLNALLGARILPVSNMRACTAAISEVTYADEDRYTADIEFLSRDEWQHETDLLRADIADSRAARDAAISDGDASPPPAHISQPAWDKVKAVYNLGDDVDLMTVDLDRLTEPHDITRVLDVGACRIECDSLDEFR